jgi:hypothetical protein
LPCLFILFANVKMPLALLLSMLRLRLDLMGTVQSNFLECLKSVSNSSLTKMVRYLCGVCDTLMLKLIRTCNMLIHFVNLSTLFLECGWCNPMMSYFWGASPCSFCNTDVIHVY